jgi:hypothetical protein
MTARYLCMMSPRDTWGNAVVCAQAAQASPSPHRRALLISLGEFWLELGRHDESQISEITATDIAVIEQIQARILGGVPTLH